MMNRKSLTFAVTAFSATFLLIALLESFSIRNSLLEKKPSKVVLPDAGQMGTNKVFIGKGDGSGQSTKSTFQSLLLPKRFQPNPNAIHTVPLGTNEVFVGKGDGSGQSTKATTQQLLMPKRFRDAAMSSTQRSLQNAEVQAGLGKAMSAEHLVPSAHKASTQSLLQPARFRRPSTQAEITKYEVSRAIGVQRHRSMGGSLAEAKTEERHQASRRADDIRRAERRQQESLNHAAQDVKFRMSEEVQHRDGRQEVHRMRHADAAAGPARTEELSTQYMDFGRKARSFYVKHGLMSQKENAWANKLGSGWEKAPVTMLAECGRGGPCSEVPEWNLKHGITSAKEAAWAKHMGVENAADKGRVMELSMSGDFDPQMQAVIPTPPMISIVFGDDNYESGVSAEVHRESPGVGDSQGLPVTGMLRSRTHTQSLVMPERFTAEAKADAWPLLPKDSARAVPIPDAFGSLGTAAQPADPVFQGKAAKGSSQLKQVFTAADRRLAGHVTTFLFHPSHAAGI